MHEIGILMPVHQPGPFLEPQLESIQRQRSVNVRLFFHIDCDENTPAAQVLREFPGSRRTPTLPGQGLPAVFFAMIQAIDEDLEFWAFADQDDIWHEEKLTRAAAQLAKYPDTPALWVSRVRLMNTSSQETQLFDVYPRKVPTPSVSNAVVETLAPGCTMVFNRALFDILRANIPEGPVLMHDSWAYLVAASIGVVIVDDQPLVEYRLHEGNAVGIKTSVCARLGRRARLWAGKALTSPAEQAQTFLSHFEDLLDHTQNEILSDLAEVRRWRLIRHWLRGGMRRNQTWDNLLLPFALVTLPSRRWKSNSALPVEDAIAVD